MRAFLPQICVISLLIVGSLIFGTASRSRKDAVARYVVFAVITAVYVLNLAEFSPGVGDLLVIPYGIVAFFILFCGPKNPPFAIKSSAGTNYFVKMVSFPSGEVTKTFYVRGGKTVRSKMPFGTYQIRYAAGNKWVNGQELFGPATTYNRGSRVLSFTRNGFRLEGHKITLCQVPNGNFPTVRIAASEF
jgi:hypothetical protein